MDKTTVIKLIKVLIEDYKITQEELGIESKQMYRPLLEGSKLQVLTNSGAGVNGNFLGVLKRDKIAKTKVNTQFEAIPLIPVVDSERVNVDNEYFICVKNK